MSYATVAECRAWIGRPGTTPTPDDVLAAVLASACEDIDAHCGRSFAVAAVDAEVTSRVYVADSPRVLIDDVCVIDGVEESEDGVAWTPAAVTWHAEPWNVTPVTTIVGDGAFSAYVRVTSSAWGWPSVPARVCQATLMHTARLHARRNSPSGVEGIDDFGAVRVSGRLDGDVARMLEPLRRADRVLGLA